MPSWGVAFPGIGECIIEDIIDILLRNFIVSDGKLKRTLRSPQKEPLDNPAIGIILTGLSIHDSYERSFYSIDKRKNIEEGENKVE